MTPHTLELAIDNTARACRYAVWIAMLEAERAGWLDVRDALYALHYTVDDRLRRADYASWRRRLEDEGPHQSEPV